MPPDLEEAPGVLDGEEGPAVALGQPALIDGELHFFGKIQQAHGVRDRYPAAADGLGDLLLGEPEFGAEPAIRPGPFHWIEVLAPDILDQRDLERLPIRDLPDDRRDGGEAGGLGRPKPALPGDDLVPSVGRPRHDRLEDAVPSDRSHELIEFGPRPPLPGLKRVRDRKSTRLNSSHGYI